jgi:hypothetical protein
MVSTTAHRADNYFPREVFFFGFGLPEVAAFSVPAFLRFVAIVSPLSRLAFRFHASLNLIVTGAARA